MSSAPRLIHRSNETDTTFILFNVGVINLSLIFDKRLGMILSQSFLLLGTVNLESGTETKARNDLLSTNERGKLPLAIIRESWSCSYSCFKDEIVYGLDFSSITRRLCESVVSFCFFCICIFALFPRSGRFPGSDVNAFSRLHMLLYNASCCCKRCLRNAFDPNEDRYRISPFFYWCSLC